MWDLPGPGLEPMFPALAGRFLTTVPPGKSPQEFCIIHIFRLKEQRTSNTGYFENLWENTDYKLNFLIPDMFNPVSSAIKKRKSWEFPGGPVVRTQCFRSCAPGLIPGQETKIPHTSFMAWHACMHACTNK